MYINRFKDIEVINLLGMQYYYISSYDLKENILTISGDIGHGKYYCVDITFMYVEYLACATDFRDTFSFRRASDEEVALMREYAPNFHWYCIEEDVSGYFQLARAPFRYFIAATNVEITVSSEKKLEEMVPGLPYERGKSQGE